MTVIGVGGHYRAGKDVIAGRLIRAHGFTRIAFADCLKREVERIFGKTLRAYASTVYGRGGAEMAHKLLWEIKDDVVRAMLQEHGTELRRAEDPEYWIKAWKREVLTAGKRLIVAADVRFENELDAVRSLGGWTILVRRPGFEGDSHVSEALAEQPPKWDFVLENDGSIEDLEAKTDDLMASLGRWVHESAWVSAPE